MIISKAILNEFKKLYAKDFGIVLKDSEATLECSLLFNAFDLIFKSNKLLMKKDKRKAE